MNTTDTLTAAVRELADRFGDEELGHDVGSHMTCGEANAFTSVLLAAGHDEAAARFLLGHASGDDDPEDDHAGWVPDSRASGIGTEEQRQRARTYIAEHLAP